ncbi:MAG: topoisomerase C-terminal repeat-containing protein, partial [Alphaproteobacteria bacterium]
FGPYVKHGSNYVSLKEDDVLTIGLNRAVSLIAESPGHGATELGAHPDDGKPVSIRKGRFGYYVKHGRVNATLPKDTDEKSVTLDEAIALLAAKASKGGGKKAKAKAPENAAGEKTPAKKGAKKATKKASKPKGKRKTAKTDPDGRTDADGSAEAAD